MNKKKSDTKQKDARSNTDDEDDLKKYIDRNEAQQKVLKKITEILEDKKKKGDTK